MCTGGRYDDDSREWFTGTNTIGHTAWETRCRVVVADQAREFAFVNHGRDGPLHDGAVGLRPGAVAWRRHRRHAEAGTCFPPMPTASALRRTRG